MTILALVLHFMSAAKGTTHEGLVEPPPWTVGAIGLAGAVVGGGLAALASCVVLPWWVRAIAVGVLVAALPVAVIACSHPKGHPIQSIGLAYGVPLGFTIGAATSCLRAASRHTGQ